MNENQNGSIAVAEPEGQQLVAEAKLDPSKNDAKWKRKRVDVNNVGAKIILPDGMSKTAAISQIERARQEEEEVVKITRHFDAFPLDGAVQAHKALTDMYGVVTSSPKQIKAMMGPEVDPPKTISVQTGVNQRVDVVWGQFTLPGIEGWIEFGVDNEHDKSVFVIFGEVKRKHTGSLNRLFDTIEVLIATESIYKGKALRIHLTEKSKVNLENPPTFMDTRQTKPEELILSDDVQRIVESTIFAPIMRTDLFRKAGIPLKRGILAEGRYGVGKTFLAAVVAKIAEEHGWTFLMLDNVKALAHALQFAEAYKLGPCVVFAEDLDRAMAERNELGNELLNTIDGVLSKHVEIMCILTTNHVEKINPAMLRPGRLDAVISISAPDKAAIERLLRQYGRGLVASDTNLDVVAEKLVGEIPATVREVVERSKSWNLFRTETLDALVSEQDLLDALNEMKRHLDLMREKKEDVLTPGEQLGKAMETVVFAGVEHGLHTDPSNPTYNTLEYVAEVVDDIQSIVS
jgi:transitional endoplasmic reticulum ATPase